MKNVASMSFIKVEASKNQERKMGIKKEELRNRNERRSEVRMMNAVRRKRSQTMYKRVRVAHRPDVFRIAENNGSQVLGKQLVRSGALIGGPKFWEIRITGNRNNADTDNDRHNTVIAHGVRPDGATTDDAGTDEGIAGDNTGQRHEDAPRTGAINEGDSRA